MKKFAALFIAITFSLGMVACGGADPKPDPEPTGVEAAPAELEEAPTEAAAEPKPLEKFEGNKMEKAEADE